MSIGKRLKAFRLDQGLLQKDLAQFFDVEQGNVSMYESDSTGISNDQLALLRKTYRLNINWLLTGKGTMYDKADPDLKRIENKLDRVIELLSKSELKSLLM